MITFCQKKIDDYMIHNLSVKSSATNYINIVKLYTSLFEFKFEISQYICVIIIALYTYYISIVVVHTNSDNLKYI
jgi:hypothetical protein